ncbi:unnamed protein product, partial [Mycena citricolor]
NIQRLPKWALHLDTLCNGLPHNFSRPSRAKNDELSNFSRKTHTPTIRTEAAETSPSGHPLSYSPQQRSTVNLFLDGVH